MTKLTFALLVILGLTVSGAKAFSASNENIKTDWENKNCKDPNFNGLPPGEDYDKLQFHNRFKLLFTSASPAPAAIPEFQSEDIEGHICYATTARYLKHKASGKLYVMFTTGDDYCDGGNTVGAIVDMEVYESLEPAYNQTKTIQDAIVAQIGDSDVACVAK